MTDWEKRRGIAARDIAAAWSCDKVNGGIYAVAQLGFTAGRADLIANINELTTKELMGHPAVKELIETIELENELNAKVGMRRGLSHAKLKHWREE